MDRCAWTIPDRARGRYREERRFSPTWREGDEDHLHFELKGKFRQVSVLLINIRD